MLTGMSMLFRCLVMASFKKGPATCTYQAQIFGMWLENGEILGGRKQKPGPMSARTLLPPASFPPSLVISVSPQPPRVFSCDTVAPPVTAI